MRRRTGMRRWKFLFKSMGDAMTRGLFTEALKFPIVLLTACAACFVSFAETPDGFVTYSKGAGNSRTLYMRKMTASGGLQAEQKICQSSGDGDIQGVISFDGKWLAFSRSTGTGDYHKFKEFDVYIVKLDGGLPASPIKVGYGYWPSWGDDSHNSTKTLYYSRHSGSYNEDRDDRSVNGFIRAVTVSADGGLSNDRQIVDIAAYSPNLDEFWMKNFQGFVQAGPTGEWCALRYNQKMTVIHWDGSRGGQWIGSSGGCMPSVCADGKYVIHAKNLYITSDGSGQGSIGGDGTGEYHYGTSVDMNWLVARTEGGATEQNEGRDVYLFKLSTSGGLSTEKQTDALITDDGSWPDVHTGPVSNDVSISDFRADPASISLGSSSTLRWSVSNATSVTLNGESVSGDSKTVTPDQTTGYTLVAEGENGPVSADVTVTVNQPELTTLEITPSSATISVNGTVEFAAATLDQSGNDFPADISWSLSSGGDLSSSSGAATTFTSNGEPGSYTLTATSGGLEQTALITVSDPDALHMKINCGPNELAVSGWEQDDSYLTGGKDYNFNDDISTEGVANAAPADVYNTVVHYDKADEVHSYNFASVPNGTYTVRMHFYDTFGGRKMNYSFEGEELISNFDIVTESGGSGIPLAKDVTVTVADGNGLQIECSGSDGSDVFESGIEILGSGVTPEDIITVSNEYTGQTYDVGTMMTITWTATPDVGEVVVEVSGDGGRNWHTLNADRNVTRDDADWGAYEWEVQQAIEGASLLSDQVMFRVVDYLDNETVGQSGQFTIRDQISVVSAGAAAARTHAVMVQRDGISLTVQAGADFSMEVLDTRGRRLYSKSGVGPARADWTGMSARGAFILRARIGRELVRRRFVIK
jgi:hypothetical protein